MTYEKFREILRKTLAEFEYWSEDAIENGVDRLRALYRKTPKNFLFEFVLYVYKCRALESEKSILKSSLEGLRGELAYQREQCKNLANALDAQRVLMSRITAPPFKSKEIFKAKNGRVKISDLKGEIEV